jgi:hypothetical protein
LYNTFLGIIFSALKQGHGNEKKLKRSVSKVKDGVLIAQDVEAKNLKRKDVNSYIKKFLA